MHADTQFQPYGRMLLEQAAAKWLALSNGNIDIRVRFDLDFQSIANLQAHKSAGDSLVLGIESYFRIANQIDELLGSPGRTPLAATIRERDGGPTMVFLIMDRIPEPDAFLSVATHEFGHVAGLPDLPNIGSIMSGSRIGNMPPVIQFDEADIALCRAARYCQ